MQRKFIELKHAVKEIQSTDITLSKTAVRIVPVLEALTVNARGQDLLLINQAIEHYKTIANIANPWTEIDDDAVSSEASIEELLSQINLKLEDASKSAEFIARINSCCWITLHFTQIQDVIQRQEALLNRNQKTIINDCLSAPMQRLPRLAMICEAWNKLAKEIKAEDASKNELFAITKNIHLKFVCLSTAMNQLMKAGEEEVKKLDASKGYVMGWASYLAGTKSVPNQTISMLPIAIKKALLTTHAEPIAAHSPSSPPLPSAISNPELPAQSEKEGLESLQSSLHLTEATVDDNQSIAELEKSVHALAVSKQFSITPESEVKFEQPSPSRDESADQNISALAESVRFLAESRVLEVAPSEESQSSDEENDELEQAKAEQDKLAQKIIELRFKKRSYQTKRATRIRKIAT